MKNALLIFLSMMFSWASFAQLKADWRRFDSIPIIDHTGDTLLNPWAGGLNNPQFSTIDLNNDGKEDLFVFERDGNKIRTFINEGGSGESKFKYDPQYESAFPELFSFALLRDYNNDGKKDIFAHIGTGIGVFKNVSTPTEIKWEQQCYFEDFFGVKQCYLTMYFGPNKTRTDVYVDPADIPAFEDIDGDGDIDVLSFGVQGNTVTYYKNISTNPDTLDFALCTQCWGNFYESAVSNDVVLDYYCSDSGKCAEIPIPLDNLVPNKKRTARHAGSTILAFDRDADGDKEILLGDVSFPNMVFCQNGGNSNQAKITSFSKDYPTNTKKVDLFIFPAAFYEDVNNDNVKDLIVAPNAPLESENHRNVFYYENTRADDRPNFVFQEREFIVGDMIDLGSGSAPVLIDINGDSLLDLLVGNSGYYKKASAHPTGLAYFENTGLYTDSTVYPIFSLRDTNYLNLFNDSLGALSPTIADIDADGDLDLMIGDRAGKVHFFENQAASPGDSVVFVNNPSWNTTIDVGSWAAPFFYDLDDDGDLDLVSGERYGSLYFYLNQGDSANPVYSNSFRMANWGGVIHQDVLGDGFSQPFIVELDTNGNIANDSIQGSTYLFVGNTDGNIYMYSNIDGNLFGNFLLRDTLLLETSKSALHGADLSRDGKLDIVYGQQMGGLGVLLKGRGFELPTPPPSYALSISVETDSGWAIPSAQIIFNNSVRVTDSLGKLVIQGLSPGVYRWSSTGTLLGTNYTGSDSIEVRKDTSVTLQLSPVLGVRGNSLDAALRIFPNPSSGKVNIESDHEILSIAIYDLSGRMIKQLELGSKKLEIDVTSLSAGHYYFAITTTKAIGMHSVILTE